MTRETLIAAQLLKRSGILSEERKPVAHGVLCMCNQCMGWAEWLPAYVCHREAKTAYSDAKLRR